MVLLLNSYMPLIYNFSVPHFFHFKNMNITVSLLHCRSENKLVCTCTGPEAVHSTEHMLHKYQLLLFAIATLHGERRASETA